MELKDFDFVRVSTPDLNGAHLSKLVSTELSERIKNNKVDNFAGLIALGIRTQIVPIDEFHIESRNAYFYPDFSTLRPIKWASDKEFGFKVGDVIADLRWDEENPITCHPRIVLIKQLQSLDGLGFELYSAFEPEFRAFKPGTYEPFTTGLDMHKTSLLAVYQRFFMDAVTQMSEAGVSIQDCCIEHGEGQLEMPLMPSYGIAAADRAFRFKQGIKEIALKHEMMISFMTKPFLSETCSGNHYNHSLLDKTTKKNAMFDSSKEDNLSDVARYWLGGILKHLASITALCCPTVNCYHRLHNFLAPNWIDWDLNKRYCSIRVKNMGENGTYIENRLPSSAACPYHVMAATIAAGVDGIKNKIEPPPKSNQSLGQLPNTFEEALNKLESNEIIKEALGETFVNYFIKIKREVDIKETDMEKDDVLKILELERHLYFEYI